MKRASYGQEARQALQPMHLLVIDEDDLAEVVDVAGTGRAAGDARRVVAVVAALGADLQAQGRESPRSRLVAIQSRLYPSGTSFSVLQATTQSMQPTHLRVSITMPKRAMASGLPAGR